METDIFSLGIILILCGLSFVTAIISGVLGIIGGVILVVGGTFMVPFDVFLPIHACVQLVANGSRVLMARSDLDTSVLGKMTMGTAIGNLMGTGLVVSLSRPVVVGIAYSFILINTWVKMVSFNFRGGLVILGWVQGFLSGMVGASGPIDMPTLIHRFKDKGDYNRIVITHSAFSAISHFFRVVAFAIWGYTYGGVWHIIALMIGTTVAGTFVGTKLRNKITNRDRMIFLVKVLLTIVVAVGLIRVIYNIAYNI